MEPVLTMVHLLDPHNWSFFLLLFSRLFFVLERKIRNLSKSLYCVSNIKLYMYIIKY